MPASGIRYNPHMNWPKLPEISIRNLRARRASPGRVRDIAGSRASDGLAGHRRPSWDEAVRIARQRPLSERERRIEELFQGRVTLDDAEHPLPRRPAILICFTNRSGSNYLAELLETTGTVNRAREFFNPPFVEKLSRRHGIASFPDYCRHISEAFRPENRYWAAKVGINNLRLLLRTGVVPQLYDPVQFVFVERRDLLEQATSFSIAAQTRQWTALHQEADHEPSFDPYDLHRRLGSLKKRNADFKRLFTALGPPVHVFYEDLYTDPVGTVRRTLAELGLEPADPRPEDCSLRIQRTERNREFKRRWLASLTEILDQSDG